MDDREQQEAALEAARKRLTEEQRQQHDRYCDHLKEKGIYTPKTAIEAAHIYETEKGVHKGSELGALTARAEITANEERNRTQADADQQKRYLAAKAEEQKAALAQQIEKQQRQEQEKQAREQKEREAKELAAREAAKREPVPGAMQRFNALLEESKAQREAQTHAANIERAGQFADNRPNYARHDALKNPQEPSVAKGSSPLEKGAESQTPRDEGRDAKAEQLMRAFKKPSLQADVAKSRSPLGKDAESPTPRGEVPDAKAEQLMRAFKNPSRQADVAKGSSLLEKDVESPTPRGEVSDAKAERLMRVFNNPSRDRDFDPTHDPSNSRNFSNGRGGRGGR